jgi:glycosyltransferase involved in cell wall biosynthesis
MTDRRRNQVPPSLRALKNEGDDRVRLTVLSVAYPFAPVTEDAVGGAEQVLWALDRAIVRAGHRSLVIAQEGSRVAGTLVPVPAADGPITHDVWWGSGAAMRGAIRYVLDRWPVDVIHLHGIDFAGYLPAPGPPVLATLHLPPDWYPPEIFHLDRPDTWLNPVSAAQRRACPPSSLLLDAIPNGVAVDRLRARVRRRGWAVALGRICPEKGFHHAIEAAKRAEVPLALAGQVYPYPDHERYHAQQIVPRLDGWRRFVGQADFARKRRLLSGARCLLIPSLAPETSSLVAMEAMACGTPVVAFATGALPEVVEHGVTGFLVNDEREMAEAIREVERIDPEACRAAARERFSIDRTAARYLALYGRMASARAGVAA